MTPRKKLLWLTKYPICQRKSGSWWIDESVFVRRSKMALTESQLLWFAEKKETGQLLLINVLNELLLLIALGEGENGIG